MSQLATWIHTPFALALGWTLVHFIWEGAVLALLLAAALRLFRPASSPRRYGLACFTLAAMPVAFAVTLAVMLPVAPPPPAALPGIVPVLPLAAPPPGAVPVAGFTLARLLDRLAWLVPFWFAGVVFFYARGLAGWMAVRRLRRRGVCAVPPVWQVRLDELAARMRLSRPVALLESCFTESPVLIGYLRPVVLLPLGCLTGLSAGQLECLLLHELAHVRRHDYLVNLLQGVIEGLLFYHPAVWWVSGAVRAERENCCDDAVVEMVGDARAYAATLASLEQRRALAPRAALAATGGNLMARIRRLTMEPRRVHNSAAPAVSAGILLVVFAAALAAWPVKTPAQRRPHAAAQAAEVALAVPPAAADRLVALRAALDAPYRAWPDAQEKQQKEAEPPASLAGPYRKWLIQDVVYIVTDEERSAFLRLQTDEERETFIENFWLERDPTPGTAENEFKEEHYRRIAYTNEHFAAGIPGWRTDRGRIYITYGPPDEIDDHSSDGRSQRSPEKGGETRTYPYQQWRYRHIQGVGDNVIIEFVDPTGSGEFRMTMDPSEKDRLVKPPRPEQAAVSVTIASGEFHRTVDPSEKEKPVQPRPEQAAVSVTIASRRHSAGQSAAIAAGDLLSLGFSSADETRNMTFQNSDLVGLQQSIIAKISELDALLKKYQPGFPEVLQAREQLARLEERSKALEVAQTGSTYLTTRNSQVAEELANLKSEEAGIKDELAKSTQQIKIQRERASELARELQLHALQREVLAAGSAPSQLQAAQAKLAEFEAANAGHPPASYADAPAEVQARNAGVVELHEQINQEMQRQATLEASLSNNHNLQNRAEADLVLHAPAPRLTWHADTQVTVRPDGRISVPGAGEVMAAGLTPVQLDAALAHASVSQIRNPSVQILGLVTIHVPLDASANWSHVFGRVATASGKLVQSFESSVPGQPALAHVVPLAAGTYHLTVVVKNQATGATRQSDLDFTVD